MRRNLELFGQLNIMWMREHSYQHDHLFLVSNRHLLKTTTLKSKVRQLFQSAQIVRTDRMAIPGPLF